MARQRTVDLPDLSPLLEPANEFARDIQRVLLRFSRQDRSTLSIAEQIAARLASMVALDQLKPGQRVLEDEICTILSVSRAPVREALRILERDRLLVIAPHKGAHVTSYDQKELSDIFEIRASLIATSFRLIIQDHPEELQRELNSGLIKLRFAIQSKALDLYAMTSFGLMISVWSHCHNKLLVDMVQSLALQTLRYSRIAFRTKYGIKNSIDGWEQIYAATCQRDANKVYALVQDRILGTRDTVLAVMPLTSKGAARPHTNPRADRAGTKQELEAPHEQQYPLIQREVT